MIERGHARLFDPQRLMYQRNILAYVFCERDWIIFFAFVIRMCLGPLLRLQADEENDDHDDEVDTDGCPVPGPNVLD
jgi:hypothetical protein